MKESVSQQRVISFLTVGQAQFLSDEAAKTGNSISALVRQSVALMQAHCRRNEAMADDVGGY